MNKKYIAIGAMSVLAITSVTFGTLYLVQLKKNQSNDITDQTIYGKFLRQDNGRNLGYFGDSYIDTLPTQDLSDAEKAMLIQMRDEEKLAFDIYTKLYEKWGLVSFKNIAQSEQTHIDRVAQLLEKYKLSDPDANKEIGQYSDSKYTDLYNQILEQGSKSQEEALIVGATIEDLDINDLNTNISKTDNTDIKAVFGSLKLGSENHLRAFVQNLERYSKTYTPKYISKDEYDEIINMPMGNGNRRMQSPRGHMFR